MNVVFHEEADHVRSLRVQPTSKLVALTIALSGGVIKNKQQANMLFLVFATAMFMASFFLFTHYVSSPVPTPTGDVVEVAGPGQQ